MRFDVSSEGNKLHNIRFEADSKAGARGCIGFEGRVGGRSRAGICKAGGKVITNNSGELQTHIGPAK